jgi:lipopolysaccharide transport system ATP-binding protein
MSDIAIKFENISKQYHLGKIGTGTLSHDLKRWWTVNLLRKEDPYLKIGQENKLSATGDRQQATGNTDLIWALKDINFEVKQGEVLGIIGKNGAGKSTLLKILSRVTTPTTGRISAHGRIASLLEVGTGFHPEMTGRENIFMNGSIMGMTKAEIIRKLDEIVDFAGVEKYIDTPVKRYSSGMTVRLGFAIAAHLDPEILVVDEVLAVGDSEFQKKALGKMQDVSRKEGRTVLFVSHNMAAISILCSKLVVLKNGKTDFWGDINDGISHYNSTVEEFRGYANLEKTKSYLWSQLKSFSKLLSIRTMNKDAVIDSVFYMGDTIFVEIEIEIIEMIRSFEIGLFFQGRNDEFTGLTLSSSEGFNDFIVGRQKIRIEIPNINLLAGNYSLGVLISRKGVVDDAKEKALKIIILSADFTGYSAAFEYGRYNNYKMLLRSKWMVVK